MTDVELAAAVLASRPFESDTGAPVAQGTIGVVVPTHNDGPNMAPLLDRLLAEPAIGEVLVIASACDDETVPTVLEISNSRADVGDGRVRLYVEAERSGKAAAVNFGIRETTMPYIVIISGDVLPEPGSIPLLVEALRSPGIGMAGGRPVPVNDDGCSIGYAVHLLWRLHHRLALHQPKLGEMIALRREAVVSLPRTSVDEACFQAMLESEGWKSAYVPAAVVVNRGPGSVRDFVKQRRQVHTGHLWLRHKQGYTVPSLQPALLVYELWRDIVDDLTTDPTRTQVRSDRPKRLAWTAGAVAMEAFARFRARADYVRGRENHVWEMVQSTKAPALDADGLHPGGGELVASQGLAEAAADQRGRQHQLSL
ncbi:MAG TPA: glycosyltransferase [Acidimicrobiales bacterium]|nr:glycosyltransferase [Acidimicrobiales bacterium]